MDSERTYGLTAPISTTFPTESDKRSNDDLIKELHAQGCFESASETQKRHQVLASLQKITDAFVKKIAKLKEPKNEVLVRDARGRVFTYGSFRLGVYGPGSDIDTLVVVPKYVTRDDYFDHFPQLLLDMAPSGSISDMAVVRDAFVPIIKFEYSGISIDLIFSRIATLKQLPADKDWNLKDNSLLRGLDDGELRSVNGTRVTDEILDLVPEPTTFRLALRAIKLWAQRRAIYANIMGYPGGVAWAMLVARVCQLYPKATSSVIVNKFFHIMTRWPWPDPVLLKHIEDGPLQVRVWNPKLYAGDRYHLMPIITPAYPSMCATFNVTKSALTVIQEELKNGAELSDLIMMGKKPWKELFVKHTFFTKGFKYYLSVTTCSTNKEAHKIWSGYVESKVRLLVQGLERHPSIALARPFNKGYERTHFCKNDAEIEAVQNGDTRYITKKTAVVETKVKAEDLPIKLDAPTAVDQNATTVADNDQAAQEGVKEEPQTNQQLKEEGLGGVRLKDVPVAPQNQGIKTDVVKNGVPIQDVPQNGNTQDENAKTESTTNGIVKSEDAKSDGTEVFTTSHYIGLVLAQGAKSLDLSYQVNEFKDLCFSWKEYKPEVNCLGIHHMRATDLPDDVFEPGEVRPTKASKKKAAPNPNGNPAPKKRNATEEFPNPPKRQNTSVKAAAAAG
ncbi:Poly(A) polymerase central domain-containing protein [Coniochaeta sp. 2T2.1]|nr:Poly(A) polymerase central domain-containing protein [Coniochaeta sp. 2T2.1]